MEMVRDGICAGIYSTEDEAERRSLAEWVLIKARQDCDFVFLGFRARVQIPL